MLIAHQAIQQYLNISIPYPHEWIVQRVDYDQVWKFDNSNQALWVLECLKRYNYRRKDLTLRGTSLTIDGTTEKIIFYLKHEEFTHKDYKKLYKLGYPLLAEYLAEKSLSLLRFEQTFKKPKLNSLFGREVTYKEVIDYDFVVKTLSDTLSTLCNSNNLVSMSYEQAVEKIYVGLSKKEAYNLLGFFNLYYAPDIATREFNRKFMKDMVSPTTIYKNKQKLKDLGIGILTTNPEFGAFDLSIPSKNVVNTADQVREIAVAIRDLLKN